jgi:hypothetical protein
MMVEGGREGGVATLHLCSVLVSVVCCSLYIFSCVLSVLCVCLALLSLLS